MKSKVQKFGKFLSGMVMPNIGALIAFGFLAAFFIETGWMPNEKLNSMVSPMLTFLIPILIAATGGKMVGGQRSGCWRNRCDWRDHEQHIHHNADGSHGHGTVGRFLY